MTFEVEEELKNLEKAIQSGELDSRGICNFFDEWEWEDSYSHDEIREFQIEFEEEVEPYLRKSHRGKYLIRESIVITKKYHEDKITMKELWKEC